jgi:hypothetical protein
MMLIASISAFEIDAFILREKIPLFVA